MVVALVVAALEVPAAPQAVGHLVETWGGLLVEMGRREAAGQTEASLAVVEVKEATVVAVAVE